MKPEQREELKAAAQRLHDARNAPLHIFNARQDEYRDLAPSFAILSLIAQVEALTVPQASANVSAMSMQPLCNTSNNSSSSNSPEIDGIARPGWKMVPVELTDDMLIAFAEAWYSKARAIDDCEMADCYAAMLAAAPDHIAAVSKMVPDTLRLDFIEKNAIKGATYKGITSANVIVYEGEWRKLGLRPAIDAAMLRAAPTIPVIPGTKEGA